MLPARPDDDGDYLSLGLCLRNADEDGIAISHHFIFASRLGSDSALPAVAPETAIVTVPFQI
jgi:hypothetical protein